MVPRSLYSSFHIHLISKSFPSSSGAPIDWTLGIGRRRATTFLPRESRRGRRGFYEFSLLESCDRCQDSETSFKMVRIIKTKPSEFSGRHTAVSRYHPRTRRIGRPCLKLTLSRPGVMLVVRLIGHPQVRGATQRPTPDTECCWHNTTYCDVLFVRGISFFNTPTNRIDYSISSWAVMKATSPQYTNTSVLNIPIPSKPSVPVASSYEWLEHRGPARQVCREGRACARQRP